MQVAAKPHVTVGIALAGAAVIAVSPIAPTLPDIHVPDIHVPGIHAAQVELAALTNPLEQWAQVIRAAISNAGALGAQLQSDPAPIIQKIIANQQVDGAVLAHAAQTAMQEVNAAVMALPTTLQTAAGQLAAGNVTGAAQTVGTALLPLVLGLVDGFNQGFAVVTNTMQNLANVVAAVPSLVLPSLLAISGPIFSTVNAVATTTQELVTAVRAGDLESVANTLINAPATVTGALLNGFGNGPLGLPSPGLLSPTGPFGVLSAGTIAGLLSLRDTIAAALHALPAPPSAAAKLKPKQLTGTAVGQLPGSATQTVTVSVPKTTSSTGTELAKPSPTESNQKDTAAGESAPQGDAATPVSSEGTSDSTTGGTEDTSKGDTADATKGNSAESTTGKTDDSSSDTGASTATPAKPSTPTSGPKHQAATGNGANSTASRPNDQGTKGSTDSHSTAKKAAKHGSK